MQNPKVAFDESGNTGQNLLSETQPVFVLASVHLTEHECAEVLSAGGFGKKGEFHFKNVKRRRNGPHRIQSMLDAAPLAKSDVAKAVVYHKRYMIVTKIVDQLVEEYLYERGVDLYQHGANIGLSNMWYFVIPSFCGEEVFGELLKRFVLMIRNKGSKDVDAFFQAVETLGEVSENQAFRNRDVAMLNATRAVVPWVLEQATVTDLDPAVPAFFELAVRWNQVFEEEFDILHDASKPIEHQEEILSSFMASDEPDVVVGWDRRKAKLPIRTSGFSFVDSAAEPLVQVADLIAGSLAHLLRGNVQERCRDELWAVLSDANLDRFLVGSVWPHPAVTPADLGTEEVGGIDPNEYMAGMIRRQEERLKNEQD